MVIIKHIYNKLFEYEKAILLQVNGCLNFKLIHYILKSGNDRKAKINIAKNYIYLPKVIFQDKINEIKENLNKSMRILEMVGAYMFY